MAIISVAIFASSIYMIFYGAWKQLCMPMIIGTWMVLIWVAFLKITGELDLFNDWLTEAIVRSIS